MSEVPLYRREAARLLPRGATALDEKDVLLNSWLITLLDSTATIRRVRGIAAWFPHAESFQVL